MHAGLTVADSRVESGPDKLIRILHAHATYHRSQLSPGHPRASIWGAVRPHHERHRGSRGGWLRAAVLGADDGVVSTASLMIGVASASPSASKETVLVAGIAGLVAGALSMAAGEYVSVSSQRDAEDADILREKRELANDPKGELEELATIYRKRLKISKKQKQFF